jgi:hypothetical protein
VIDTRLRWALVLALLASSGWGLPGPQAGYAAQPMAQVRVAHVAPGVAPLTVFIDGVAVLGELPFGEVSAYVPVLPGARALAARAEGAPPELTVFDAAVPLAPGGVYTVLALSAPPGAEPLVLDDTPVGAPGVAQVRFVHASPNAPAVDIAIPGLPPLFAGVEFGTVTPYAEVQPGVVTIEARLAGTPQLVADIPGLALAPGGAYTLVAIGLLGGAPPLGILTIPGA